MKRILLVTIISILAFRCIAQERAHVTIYGFDADLMHAMEMNIERIKPNEREAFDEFCNKIVNPFLRIIKANIGETRQLVLYVKKLPKEVDYNAVANYTMICALSTGLKVSGCTIVDVDTVNSKTGDSIEAEVLGGSFWNKWEIKN